MASLSLFGNAAYTINDACGAGYLEGVVNAQGSPARRWVYVYQRSRARIVASVFSESDGTFRVDALDPNREFDVSAKDLTGNFKDAGENSVHPWPYSGSPPSWPHGTYVPPDGNDIELNLDDYTPTRLISTGHAFA